MNKALFAGLVVIAIALGGGYLYLGSSQQTMDSLAGAKLKQLPDDRSFTDLTGNSRNLSEWQGKLLVINFWATWCPPCREEMPLFVEMQQAHEQTDLQFLGIAIDDPDMVKDFTDVYDINFPILTGGPEAITLANELGNRFDGLPFTAVFDASGRLRYIQAGKVTRTHIEREILPLL